MVAEQILLDEVVVQGGDEYREGYRATGVSSPTYTQPLVDTPRTVTVVTQKQMEERGLNSLAEVLRTTPGITLGTGEGGTPQGDRPFIRGFEASTDMTVDGVRLLGRNSYETFALEAVEISKGPGGAYDGRGSTGGTINMVTKTPGLDTFVDLSATVGTDSYKRGTLDTNQYLGNGVGVRFNAMWHDQDVAGRDHVFQDRWGVAPSIAFGLDGPTQATFSFYHLETDEIPDLGHPFPNAAYQASVGGNIVATPDNPWRPVDVRRDNFYGAVTRDFRETTTSIGQARFDHEFTENFRFQNTTLYARGTNEYIMTRPTLVAGSPDVVDRSQRSTRRKNDVITNQTTFTGEFFTGEIEHNLAFGTEFTRERLRSGGYGPGSAMTVPPTDLFNPDNFPSFDPSGYDTTPYGDPTTTRTKAAFIFDTIKLNEQWQVLGGLRFDDYNVNDGTVSNDATMVNYQVGAVYKPLPYGSFYVVHGTSSNPSGETAGQSGGADGSAGGGLGGSRPNLDPEKNRSYEVGTKWDLFDERLSLTAALFYTEKTNQRATDPATGEVALIGNSRARGVELGVAGEITDRWSIFGGYTYIDAELVDDGAGSNDGNQLKYIAPHSFSLWSTYDVTEAFTVGGGAYYMDARYVNDANTLELPSYWRVDLMASYQINDNFDVQLNVNNLFDETIYEGSHVGLFANVGAGRSFLVRANASF